MSIGKQRNGFRWVALRGPAQDSRRPVPVARRGDGQRPTQPTPFDLFVAIRASIDDGLEPDPARERAARLFIASEDYVFRSRLWTPFLGLRQLLNAAIGDAAAGDGDGLASEIESILEPATGGLSLPDFVGGPMFASLRETLWQSYYAKLILPDVRPLDLPVLVFWIRFFKLVQALVDGEDVNALLANFSIIRPAVPIGLVGRAPERVLNEVASLPSDDDDNAAMALAEARREIELLRQVRARLGSAVEARLGDLSRRGAIDGEASDASSLADPLAIRPDDLEEADRAVLERAGVRQSGSYLAVTAAIDSAVAAKLDDVEEIENVSEVAVVGGVLVRRRRRRAAIPEPVSSSPRQYEESGK